MPEELSGVIDLLYQSYDFLANNPYGRMISFSVINFAHAYISSKNEIKGFNYKHRLKPNLPKLGQSSKLGKIISWENIIIYPLFTGITERTIELITLNNDEHYGPFFALTIISRSFGSYLAYK